MESIMNNSLDSSEFLSLIDKSRFLFPLVIFVEMRVGDGIYINVVRGLSGRFVGRVVLFNINFMKGEKNLNSSMDSLMEKV